MQNAVAFANNDVITVAWSFGQRLERCMGFAVYRVDADGKETALPAVAVFPGFKRAAKTISLGADGTLTSWFSPNTPKLRSSSTKNEQRPPDMTDVFAAIQAAKRAVLFLVFYPGSPNVAQWAADAQKANK